MRQLIRRGANKARRVMRALLKRAARGQSSSTPPAPPRLSLVVACYNVEPYLGRFLTSVFNQSSRLSRFEVILVDDGSTDGTAEIARNWQSCHPEHVRYIHQENAGVSGARNAGLAIARGTWVSFPDPDDFLDVNYFRRMLEETEATHAQPLLAVVSNLVLYFEDRDEFSDSHPLRYRFQSGTVRKSTDDLGQHIQLFHVPAGSTERACSAMGSALTPGSPQRSRTGI